MTEKYLIALEIDEVQEGATLGKVPLHSTIMHWFSSRQPTEEVVDMVRTVLDEQPPILIVSGEADLFGVNSDVPVNRVRNVEPVTKLHRRLFTGLGEIEAVHEAPGWTLDGFNPHVSVVNGVRFHEGEQHLATHAYIVSAKTDDPMQKYVVARMELAGE